ncbi:FAD-binding protein [uncultured Propionivibrio sp.]|uniref:FAD-binding protein n=1 Tax=uncultured Propionivibrio sp. TaxID=426737 RepID=UPI0029BFD7FA|nr:FAD-binding protein [uncultured Propionivibrio sp.]
MANAIPQHILDAMTDVHLPREVRPSQIDDIVEFDGLRIPVYRAPAVVLGSGAAGLRAAVELKRRGVDVMIVTRKLFWGTSAFSGSDKQTLHTACTKHRGDDFTKMAQALGGGGAMDSDVAYVEAVGSIDAFSGLKFLGLPLPEDAYGAVLRYQTDHDEYGRATSCGPRTSRLMVKVLAEEAIRLGIPFLDHATGMALLKQGGGDDERVAGLLLHVRSAHENAYGLCAVLSPNVVLASGGPGELYRDSVYPKNCFGSLGMALEAGLVLTNLTEHQFGIGTRRTEFPWNLSGTYVQVMPYVYSTDENGTEYNFLADYYRTTQELVSNVFRKGYQWPFHASRTLDYGSSLVDLAIYRETRKGRTVWLDFNRNPQPVPGDQPFDLTRLDPDVRAYLENNQALQSTPIERLRCMNPLAIELYRQYKMDLARAPIPFNVNHQHMNGGVEVDTHARSSLAGCYAVGEIAGTHGVTRPGGAALNAGQVFGRRCAAHIAERLKRHPATPEDLSRFGDALTGALAWFRKNSTENHKGLALPDVAREIQDRMSDHAGYICHVDTVGGALEAARDLNRRIAAHGVRIPDFTHLYEGVLRAQTALLSEAVLAALDFYVRDGGGSRGARMLCDRAGVPVPSSRLGELEEFRIRPENTAHRTEKILLRYRPGHGFEISKRALRGIEDTGKIYFEKNWGAYLTGAIYPE